MILNDSVVVGMERRITPYLYIRAREEGFLLCVRGGVCFSPSEIRIFLLAHLPSFQFCGAKVRRFDDTAKEKPKILLFFYNDNEFHKLNELSANG